MTDQIVDVKIALDEMRLNMKQSLDAADSLDKKLNQTALASGAILSIITVLNLSLSFSQTNLYWLFFLFVLGIYITNIVIALIAARPQAYKLPVEPSWAALQEVFFDQTEREIYLRLLSGYVDQINHNRKINSTKAKLYICSAGTIPLAVVLLCILMIIN